MPNQYKNRTISHDLQELIEMIDTEKFAESLARTIQGVRYEADMVLYHRYDDEPELGWEIKKLDFELQVTEKDGFKKSSRTISDRNTAALVLGKAILDTLEIVFIEPRFRDGYGE
jgi:hypothetical protein